MLSGCLVVWSKIDVGGVGVLTTHGTLILGVLPPFVVLPHTRSVATVLLASELGSVLSDIVKADNTVQILSID